MENFNFVGFGEMNLRSPDIVGPQPKSGIVETEPANVRRKTEILSPQSLEALVSVENILGVRTLSSSLAARLRLFHDSVAACRAGTAGFVHVMLYSTNKLTLFTKFQNKVEVLDCAQGRGQTVILNPQSLVDLLRRGPSSRYCAYDTPIIVSVFVICEAILLPQEDTPGSVIGGVTLSAVSTLFALIMRKPINDYSKIDRMITILKLADIDNDDCLTIGEIFGSLFLTESVAIRLRKSLSASTDSPEMISILANKFATQLTSIIVQSVYPDCDDFRKHLSDHSMYLVPLDQARAALETNQYFLSSLPNPAALDVNQFIPESACEGPCLVRDEVIRSIRERESSKVGVARMKRVTEWLRSCHNETIFQRLLWIKRGLELTGIIHLGDMEESDGAHSDVGILFEKLERSMRSLSLIKDASTPAATSTHDDHVLASFASISGIGQLERIGKQGHLPPTMSLPQPESPVTSKVRLYTIPATVNSHHKTGHKSTIAKSRMETFRRSISSSSIILLNSQLSQIYSDQRPPTRTSSSPTLPPSRCQSIPESTSAKKVYCVVCDAYHR